MVVLTALVALKKGKVTEDELLNEKISLLKRLLNKGFTRNKIEALIGFLKLYVRFSDNSENDFKFDEALSTELNKPIETMGIVEFVLERERKKGEEKGIEKGMEKQTLQFVQTLLKETNFDDTKIAALTSVDADMVRRIRAEQ